MLARSTSASCPLRHRAAVCALALLGAALTLPAAAQSPAPAANGAASAASAAPTSYDAALAQRLGANDGGMRSYVLVILKTGPTPLPAGPERDAMFRGHFGNMQRLADEGKLVFAGPLDGKEGRRGIFVFAVKDVEEAQRLAATDPVLAQGEMAADYHRLFGSAALMLVREVHPGLVKRKP